MTVPVLLVTGFLGAGKTTAINRLLRGDHGQRIAAIVNDFGAINIDAEMLENAADTVVGLQNGCICCSMQGDLLRTLRLLLDRTPRPERIIIEASGAADPRGIIEALTDDVLWNSVRLDAVVCLVDAEGAAEDPALRDDPLWRAQWQHSDFILLAKTAAQPEAMAAVRAPFALARKPVFDVDAEPLPVEVLFGPRTTVRPRPTSGRIEASRFVTLDWHSAGPVSLAAFRQTLARIAPGLLRAKGYLDIRERPGRPHLLQLVGRRVSFTPAPTAAPGCRLVLIGARDMFDADAARAALTALVPADSPARGAHPDD